MKSCKAVSERRDRARRERRERKCAWEWIDR
jgi:hypothetical protein